LKLIPILVLLLVPAISSAEIHKPIKNHTLAPEKCVLIKLKQKPTDTRKVFAIECNGVQKKIPPYKPQKG
jgi:hypothetical protein